MTPVLELQDLHVLLCARRHQGVELVKGVSFSVYPGECLGILGESGSGKSMSMKAAMGLLDHGFHVLGSAKFQGEELLGKSDEELRRLRGGQVGIILQNPMTCFDPLYRIGAQIAETFAAHNNWSKEDILQRSLEMLGKMRIRNPEEVLEKYPHQLSGGEQQRIAIAIALANNPKLLLADEPTGSVDTKTADIIFDIFRELNRNGQTILIVTHDIALSKKVRRVVAIRDGKISSERILKEKYADRLKELTVDWRNEDTQEEYAVIDKAGRVQIPRELWDKLALRDNKVKLELRGDEILLSRPAEDENRNM